MTDNCPHCESEKKQRFPLRGGTQFKCGTIIYERYTDEQSAICKRIAELQAQVEALKDPSWKTYIKITKQFLTHYPADIFDGSSGYPGPLFVVALRNAVQALEARGD